MRYLASSEASDTGSKKLKKSAPNLSQKEKRPRNEDADGDVDDPKNTRKLPKRRASCSDFREKGSLRLRKEDCIIEAKREKTVDEENVGILMTASAQYGNENPPQRRILDFILHDEEGKSQPVEMLDVIDIYISALILPKSGDLDKEKGLRCEGFGRVESWSITGYEDGVAAVWFSTGYAEYMCVKPAGCYKKFFDMFYEKAALCIEVYRALSKPDGGDPELGFDDMVAQVIRSMNTKKGNNTGRFYGRDYVVSNGEFVANQLMGLDKTSSGTDQFFSGLPALVTLENECRKLDISICRDVGKDGSIKIQEGGGISAPACSSPGEDVDEDEKFARLLQEEENWNAMKTQRRAPAGKKKFYIKINENEIANDYPLPAFYKSTEDEMDEYVFFDDDTPILATEDLPRRMLHDWSLYNSDSRFVPLELLPMLPNTEADVEVFGSGIMTEDDGSGYCLDGDSDSHTSKSQSADSNLETPQGIHIYLSAVKEWMIEFGASMLFISIRTDGAWYRLGKPLKQYAPWYKPILKTAKLAINIITMLKNQSRVSKLSFADVIRKLAVQDRNEPTFISSNLADVERYVVVHGQIILQQFAEYPDDLIRRSAFVIGLSDKMEQRKHTKLLLTKKKVIIKERNLNPRSSLKFEASRLKQMRATTTKLIYRIWKEYYSNSNMGSNDCGENDGKEIAEQEDQEQSEDEEETILVSENTLQTSSSVKIGRGSSSTKEAKWVGMSSGKLPAGEPLYRSALVHGDTVAVGGVVLVDSEGSDDLPALIFVEYMFEKSDGTKSIHGRLLERGAQTVLGNAADVREVFLTVQCVDVELNSVKGSVTMEIRRRPWGYQYRKENAAADEIDRVQAKELEKQQLPPGYFCKSLYSPEKGAFFSLPFDTLGLGTGQCHACKLRENERKKEFELFRSKDGFTYKGVDYFVHDFVYIDPLQLPSTGEEKEIEKFKAGRNKGLKAYAVCQILEIKVANGLKKADLKSVKITVKRLFRPEDVGFEKAYTADIREVYYSEETVTLSVGTIHGKCDVRRQHQFSAVPGNVILEHTFWCSCIFDPSKGTVKQLPANVKLSSSKSMADAKGKSHMDREDVKMKGKAIIEELPSEEKMESSCQNRLLTLDIFAGCGGLSHGLQQSGVSLTKWAIEYEEPAAEAFKLNHPEAEVFCDNCNVILRSIMEKGGDVEDCISTTEAAELSAKLTDEQRKNLPMPGQVDFINGGPPCQGFSGMNRFNQRAWSKVQCEMILGFLSYADYFRPRFFLLENVRNFVSFNKGQTFRLTLASLLEMGYQVRFGVLQAGNYGVSQSRKRAFIWAASPQESLPEWPEPMHVFGSSQLKISLPGGFQYAAVRDAAGGAPFRSITVRDTIGDLPPVGNGADKLEIKYGNDPASWFQKQIRGQQSILYDHISKEMNELNYIRCQRIPKRPGSDWRDLPEEKVKLSTGQLVDLIPWCLPNTADRHNQWKGLFGRLDWEGNFPTSITDPQPMGKVGMCFHPEQDRILTVRECARSQGFPDSYKFCGTIQSKHRQIGNAVPPPLATALGKKLKEVVDAKRMEA